MFYIQRVMPQRPANALVLNARVKSLYTILIKVLTVLLLAGAIWTQERNLRQSDTAWIEPPAHQDQELDPRLIEIASLGHVATWVDAVLIKSLGDPAYDPVIPGTHPPLYFELKLATSLDPLFHELYYYGASILSVVRRDGPGAGEILDRADALIKQGKLREQAYSLELFRGYNALFETHDIETAQDAFEQAAKTPQAPKHMTSLAARMKSPEGRFLIAGRTLKSLLQRKNDPKTQELLETRQSQLEKAEELFRINTEFLEWSKLKRITPNTQAFRKFTQRQDLKWDESRRQVESLESREPLLGFY